MPRKKQILVVAYYSNDTNFNFIIYDMKDNEELREHAACERTEPHKHTTLVLFIVCLIIVILAIYFKNY